MRRLAAAALSGLATSIFLGLLPAMAPTLIQSLAPTLLPGIPREALAAITQLARQLIPPSLPIIGFGLAVIAFLAGVLKDSRVGGALVALQGLGLILYVYTAFQGGRVGLTLSVEVGLPVQAHITLDLVNLMFLFLLPPTLVVAKGLVLSLMRRAPTSPT
jgi:hypothetical protein